MFEQISDPVARGTATTIQSARKSKPARPTDGTRHYTPRQLADRWNWHPESVRRAIRERRIESILVFRRRLIPVAAIERIEAEGRIPRAA